MLFFAELIVALDFMEFGTKFHIRAESVMNVEFKILHPNDS